VKEAASNTGATVERHLRAARRRCRAIWEAVEADLDLAICITGRHPRQGHARSAQPHEAKEAKGRQEDAAAGPPTARVSSHRTKIKIGIMPGHIHRKGRIGVVSRSGTLTYEPLRSSPRSASANRARWASAATRSTGSSTSTSCRMFNDDPGTDAVINDRRGSAAPTKRMRSLVQGQHERSRSSVSSRV